DLARDALLLHQDVPVQKQIVVVEQLLRVFDLDVAAEQLRQLVAPVAAPGEYLVERLRERLAAVDAVGIDRQAGVLAWKALLFPGEPELLPQKIQQIGGVAAIEHRERRLQPDDLRVLAQQPVADRVIGPGPEQPRRIAPGTRVWIGPQRFSADAFRAAQHLLRGAPRERQQQD